MALKIGIGFIILLGLFGVYVSTRDGNFHYERSGLIQASPERIFPYLSDFHKGALWSPYEKVDPNMKKTFSGPEAQVGAVMEFEGNSQTGSGKLEVLKLVPNELVEIKLTMLKPFYGENIVQYRLTSEGNGTRFSWAMSGDGGFMGKLMSMLIDCEKMIGEQFSTGINNLKTLVESETQK